jgi:hypothetical protein
MVAIVSEELAVKPHRKPQILYRNLLLGHWKTVPEFNSSRVLKRCFGAGLSEKVFGVGLSDV